MRQTNVTRQGKPNQTRNIIIPSCLGKLTERIMIETEN